MNCWEFKKCGREQGGEKVEEFGACPAYPDHGTRCTEVTGTICDGEVQDTFVTKFAHCINCNFCTSEHYIN